VANVTVKIIDNGPIKISGEVNLVDENDNPVPPEDSEDIWLCRCGQSKEKPFCDGTHDKCGFAHKVSS
jgi:CDGSH-type Zn-finger protein